MRRHWKNEKFEDKEEFYSKVESLNIQIYDEDNEESPSEENSEVVTSEKKKILEEQMIP